MSIRCELVHQLLDRAAEHWAERTAITTKTRSVTFAELQGQAARHAEWLREQGIEPGDRVVIEADNSIESVALIFGVLALGAAFCPMHPSTPERQRAYVVENSGARLAVLRDGDRRVANTPSGSAPVPAADAGVGTSQPSRPLSAYAPGAISEDVACLIYTSGSTGLPKGVTCLHRQMMFAIEAIAERLEYTPDDTIFLALPLSFDYGLYQVFLGLQSGARLHMVDPRVASLGLVKALKASEATILPAVPPMLDNLAVLGRRRAGGLQSLRLITNTGAAAVPATIAKLRESFPNLRFQLMYGLTECKRATICPPDADLERPGTCGLPLRGTAVRIIDEDGNEVPPGVVGEIVIRGPHVMAGYWNDEKENAKRYVLRNSTIRELRTGDYGWLDAEGYLYCQGRRDDIFKQRGFRVSCSEVEAAALAIDGVSHAVLIPPANNNPSVLVVCFEGEAFDVIGRLRQHLEDYKLPAKCISLPSLPTTPNGKFDRKALQRIAHERPHVEKGETV